jgi:arylsulfatase A-like enzyme
MERPLNILWMVTDHQAHANRATGHEINSLQARLAREGTRFTRARTVLPICSPARASMLTGLYPHAHGVTENDGRFGGRPGLDPDDWLLHRPLIEAGHRCAWFGKWHLDQARSATDYGFEGFSLPGYGYPYGTAAYRDYLDRGSLTPPVATIEMPGESELPTGTRIALAEADDWFDYESGVARLDGPAEAHEAYFVAALAEAWLGEVGEEPFFLRIDPWGPHPPYLLAPPFLGLLDERAVDPPANLSFDLTGRPAHHGRYRDHWSRTLGLETAGWRRMAARALEHAALVEAALLGVLDTLDRLGLAERTLVIFTADHGDAVGSNGGVCNKGGLMVEETMGIPLLVRGPGVPPGGTCDHLVSNLDIPPTILRLRGLDGEDRCQGRSLLDPDGRPPVEGRKGFMAQHYGLHEAIVQRAYYAERWKLVVQEDGFAELYDLTADPCELRNLAMFPEHLDNLEAMWAGLLKVMEQTGDRDPRLAKILTGPSG